MGLLDFSRVEHHLHAKYIAEAAKLRGQPFLLYQVESSSMDLQNDKDIIYKDPVPVSVIFEDNPRTILKKMNWFTEDEDLPYVAYLVNLDDSYGDIRVTKDCLLETRSIQVSELVDSKFVISSVRGNSINPVYWICKLVPYRPKSEKEIVNDPESPNNTEMGYSYIKRG